MKPQYVKIRNCQHQMLHGERNNDRPSRVPNPGQLKFYSGVLVVLIEIWLGFIFQLMPLNQDKSLPRLVH